MTTNQLTAGQAAGSGSGADGMEIVTRRDQIWATPGRYGWDGGYGTSWANDPAENLIAILMTQRMGFPALSPLYLDFRTSVYRALA